MGLPVELGGHSPACAPSSREVPYVFVMCNTLGGGMRCLVTLRQAMDL